jgi:hypothetical protein
MAIGYICWLCGTFSPVLVSIIEKNLANPDAVVFAGINHISDLSKKICLAAARVHPKMNELQGDRMSRTE